MRGTQRQVMDDDRPVTAKRQLDVAEPILYGGTILVTALVAFLVVFPLFHLVRRGVADLGISGWQSILTSPGFWEVAGDTAFVVLVASVLSVVIAVILAWLNERTDAGIGVLGDVLPLVPLFIPAVAMAIGLVMLLSPNTGFINSGIRLIPGLEGFTLDIYTRYGLIAAYVIALVPYAYIPISAGFKGLDLAKEEAARIFGAGPLRVLKDVAARSILPPVIAGFTLCLIVGFALYSVPVIIAPRAGIEIVSVRIVRSITRAYPPAYDTAVSLSIVLFITLGLVWWAQQRLMKGGRFATVGQRTEGGSVNRLGRLKWPARALLVGYLVLSAVLPIVALVLVSFQRFWNPNLLNAIWTLEHYRDMASHATAQSAFGHSLGLGLAVGILTVAVSALVVVYQRLRRNWFPNVVDSVAKSPAAVANTAMALAFIFAFAGPPFNLGGTLTILGLGYLVVFVPYAMIAVEGSRAQIGQSLVEASYIAGAGDGMTTRSIVLPLMRTGLFAAWALVFVRMFGDLALAVLLSTTDTAVVGYVLLDWWEQGTFNRVAAASMVLTVVSAVVVGVMVKLGRPAYK